MDAASKLVAVLLYLTALILIGVLAARRTHDLRDYVVGGKRQRFWAIAFSARATGESAWLLLGLTGMGAAVGVRAFWVVLGEILGVGAAWLLMARRFKHLTDRYDSVTVPDYLEARFRDTRHHLRIVAALALTTFVTIYVSAQIDATGQAFERFLGWNYFVGAIVGFAVVMIYTTTGGFIAVVWSDVFQGLMMFLGLVTLPIVGIAVAGGLGPVLDGLREIDPVLLSFGGSAGWTPVEVASILALACIGIGFLGSPQIFVRFIAIRSDREIGRGAAVALTWTILADAGAVLIGMLARHLVGSAGEGALPDLASHVMPTFIVGVYVAIVLSAIMSTADSLLVVASSAAVRDYYQRVKHPTMTDEELLSLGRRATVSLALLALAVAMTVAVVTPERTIFWFVIFGWSGIAATFCPTIILSLVWKGFTARGALVAMVAGFLCVPLFKFLVPSAPVVGPFFAALEELVPAFVVSGTLGVLVSLGDGRGRERLRDVSAEPE